MCDDHTKLFWKICAILQTLQTICDDENYLEENKYLYNNVNHLQQNCDEYNKHSKEILSSTKRARYDCINKMLKVGMKNDNNERFWQSIHNRKRTLEFPH